MILEPTKVLICEDDTLVSQVIERELKKIGAQIVGKATDGAMAIQLTAQLKPDVILMDIEMPEKTGIEATQAIQSLCPTPIIMMTVYDHPNTSQLAAKAGASSYLIKPPKAAEIERAIQIARARFSDFMELRKLNQELKSALDQIQTLKGLLPICAWCKNIRNDQGYWQQLEEYLMQHTNAAFSHGICPQCKEKISNQT